MQLVHWDFKSEMLHTHLAKIRSLKAFVVEKDVFTLIPISSGTAAHCCSARGGDTHLMLHLKLIESLNPVNRQRS